MSRINLCPPLSLIAGVGLAGGLSEVTLAQWVENDCRQVLEVNGDQQGDLFGWRVTSPGDVDGDGVADFAVAAPFHSTNMGRVSVFSGANGDRLWFRTGSRQSSILGQTLGSFPDVDGDGVREVVSAAPFSGNGGRVYVDSGATGANLHTFAGRSMLGTGMATGGDFDGDGVEDLVLGDIGAATSGGRVFVYSGQDFSIIERINRQVDTDRRFGVQIAFIGDVNGDQRDDLAIGARLDGDKPPGRIEVYAYDGANEVYLYTIENVDLCYALCGDELDGGKDANGDQVPDILLGESLLDQARLFSGVDGSLVRTFAGDGQDSFGSDVRMLDDFDGDGCAEILVGASDSDAGRPSAGKVFLFSGLDGSDIATMTSKRRDLDFGRSVESMGDMNGDGLPEILVGAWSGSAFVMSLCRATSVSYGDGLAGTLGVPDLSMPVPPVLGSVAEIAADNSLGAVTTGFLLLGVTPGELPAPWGGTWWVIPDSIIPVAIPATGLRVTAPIPDDKNLCGVELRLQLLESDPGAVQGVSSTPGLAIYLGR